MSKADSKKLEKRKKLVKPKSSPLKNINKIH